MVVLYLYMMGDDFYEVSIADDSRILARQRHAASRHEGQEVLSVIDEVLKEASCSLNDLGAVSLLYGTGSYTSHRISVVTLNTLAYTLQIPVCGIHIHDIGSEYNLERWIEHFTGLTHPHGFVAFTPQYEAEPNIG